MHAGNSNPGFVRGNCWKALPRPPALRPPHLCGLRHAARLDMSDPSDFTTDPPLRVQGRPGLIIDSLDQVTAFIRPYDAKTGDPMTRGSALPVGKGFNSRRSQERRRCVPMLARAEPPNGDTRARPLIGNLLAKRDIADRVDVRALVARGEVRPPATISGCSLFGLWSKGHPGKPAVDSGSGAKRTCASAASMLAKEIGQSRRGTRYCKHRGRVWGQDRRSWHVHQLARSSA
jgi:hypothetical protein